MLKRYLMLCAALACLLGPATAQRYWLAGAAAQKITPAKPIWLSGYASRTKPADGALHDLWARALVLQAGGRGSEPVVLITLDLVGTDRGILVELRRRLAARHNLGPANFVLCNSHTHSGPVVGHNLETMYFLDTDQSRLVAEYTEQLLTQIETVVDQAMARREPCRASTGQGQSGIAVNRRNNPEDQVVQLRAAGQLRGPVDHDVPVLRVTTLDGRMVAVVVGYACHATTLDGYQWSGDYPGFACDRLAATHPEIVPLFWAGCGGDQNPIPRRTVELAREYGQTLASEVDRVLSTEMTDLPSSIDVLAYREIELQLAQVPSRDELDRQSASDNRYEAARARALRLRLDADGSLSSTYPYPITAWRLGGRLNWLFLGGEVTVDYSLRLKGLLGPQDTWVTGYTNDVMAYIPSKRVLLEGGYEGGGAMLYYGLPSPWAEDVEDRVVHGVRQALGSYMPIETPVGQGSP